MAKIKAAQAETEKKKFDFMAVLTGAWMIAITAVFPLFVIQQYANILNEKYGFMLIADCVLLGGFILWAIIAGRPKKYIASMKSCADPETGKWFGNWFRQTFNWLDIFMMAFLAIVIVSTLLASPYVYQAFFGNEGRWVGMITLALFCVTFFIASRYFKFSKWYIILFLIGTLLVSLWSITDYFNMDIMGFKYGLDPESSGIFTSSLGNIDTYCGFAAIPMAFAGIMFIFSKDKAISVIFYWICFAAAIFSMMTSAADNAYLSIAVFFGFAPLAAFRTRSGIRRYLITLASFITFIALIGYCNVTYADIVVIPSGVITVLSGIDWIWYVAIALWAFVIFLYIFDRKIKKVDKDALAPGWIHTVWIILLIAAAVLFTVIFIVANVNADRIPSVLEPMKDYLVFDDDWGCWRGYVWKAIMELYGKLPFLHKLFGTGPETVCIYLFNESYFDVAAATKLLFDSPHNESLMMLFNLGPIGLISYWGAFIVPVVMAFKRSAKRYYPVVLAAGFVCICHLAESFVNITTPMDIPTIGAIMAMAQCLFRSKE